MYNIQSVTLVSRFLATWPSSREFAHEEGHVTEHLETRVMLYLVD